MARGFAALTSTERQKIGCNALAKRWANATRSCPFVLQKCSEPGCERENTGNLHSVAKPRALAVKGTDGQRTVLIYPMRCAYDSPYKLLHGAYLGPNGEQLTPVLDAAGRRKRACWIFTDAVTGERVETESSHARAMGKEETRANLSKGGRRGWKKHREQRLSSIREANSDPQRRAKISATNKALYGDSSAPETWTVEQRKAREKISKGNKSFWAELTPQRRKRQVNRQMRGFRTASAAAVRSEKLRASWAQRKEDLQHLRAKAWRPADWQTKPIDWRIIGNELLSEPYMSNVELGRRLDSFASFGLPLWRGA